MRRALAAALAAAVAFAAAAACGTPDLTYATGAGGASSGSSRESSSSGPCPGGFADCNLDPSDGCEADLATNADHCGTCDRACAATHVGSRACVDGKCVSTCAPGFANCKFPDANGPDDGCEARACGACGATCPSGACQLGTCACVSNTDCAASGTHKPECIGSTCRCDLKDCVPGETCINDGGTRCSCGGGDACTPGQLCCGDACVAVGSDPKNCGACGRHCPAGFLCLGGACACDNHADCDAGAGPFPASSCGPVPGRCACLGATCAEAQRCQPSGTCG